MERNIMENEPIAICAHCKKTLTASEIKLSVKGNLIKWDERQERSNVVLDYCIDGAREIEQTFQMTLRKAAEREEAIRQMDALDKLQRGMNKKNGLPTGLPT
jgi:hypothetical protein